MVFEEQDLGVSFVLARFDSVDGKHNELGRRFVVVGEPTRPLGVARRMLAPTDELVGIVGSEGLGRLWIQQWMHLTTCSRGG